MAKHVSWEYSVRCRKPRQTVRKWEETREPNGLVEPMEPDAKETGAPTRAPGMPPYELMLRLQRRYGLTTFVETRTAGSVASEWAWGHFRRVLMVEPTEPLSEWLPRVQSPALIWLNGHSGSGRESSIGRLLEQCKSLDRANLEHVVVVDDGQHLLEPGPPAQPGRPTLGEVLRALGCPTRRRALVLENAIVALPLLSVLDQLLDLNLF
jgi:hypothetical protein